MRVLILTVSDSVASGNFADKSGPAVAERCVALGWQIVGGDHRADDREGMARCLKPAAEEGPEELVLPTVAAAPAPSSSRSGRNSRGSGIGRDRGFALPLPGRAVPPAGVFHRRAFLGSQ